MPTNGSTMPPQLPLWSSGHVIFNRWLRDLFKRPELYWHYAQLTRALITNGKAHYGSKGVYETMRYHRTIEGHDATGVRVSNDYTSWYSRLWTLMNPDHEGFFKFRPLTSFNKPAPRRQWNYDPSMDSTEPKIDPLHPERNEEIVEALRELARFLLRYQRDRR